MREVEVRQLFFLIFHAYNSFEICDDKVTVWVDLLKDVPFTLAQSNLREYVSKIENKFPPHPGALAARPAQTAEGRYIPNAEETRLMINQQKAEWAKTAVPPPAELRAKIQQLLQRGAADDI